MIKFKLVKMNSKLQTKTAEKPVTENTSDEDLGLDTSYTLHSLIEAFR